MAKYQWLHLCKFIPMYASVSFPLQQFRTFDYLVPGKLRNTIRPGVCVRVELGNSSRIGFVTGTSDTSGFKGEFKEISSISDDTLTLPDELWSTMEWMCTYYVAPIGRVLKSAIPLNFMDEYSPHVDPFVQITQTGFDGISQIRPTAHAQRRILEILASVEDPVRVASLKAAASSPLSICRRLEAIGWVTMTRQPRIYDPFDIMAPVIPRRIVLSEEQETVYSEISKSVHAKRFSPFLLHGVTGSGKTEVYLKLAQDTVSGGKSVLVLVPEIALTPQVAKRFRYAFGDRVALWHSAMTRAEKGWTWRQLKHNNYSVVVGARSAIFAPLENLGLIIIDEEQESSYKQEGSTPFYHARDVAMVRGQFAHAAVVLTSATPSLESYFNGLTEKYSVLRLTKRYGMATYPQVKLVDMKLIYREEKPESTIFSRELIVEIQSSLSRQEQIILLRNRRGYSMVLWCLKCGQVTQCHQCSVSMTYHKLLNKLICHYCQSSQPVPAACSWCGSEDIQLTGTGTQKVEEEVERLFTGARVIRMDQDTVRNRGSHHRLLEKFGNRDADILLGTQMIAKGLDFENVTLVGIINADSGLFFPDFRAGERVFQLVYQVCGRAGRGKKPGRAIIQTYNPDDPYIQNASRLDTHRFYNQVLAERRELSYPPFSRLSRLLFTGKKKQTVEETAVLWGRLLKKVPRLEVLGPAPAPIERIRMHWRFHILIKQPAAHPMILQRRLIQWFESATFKNQARGVRIQFIPDPISVL